MSGKRYYVAHVRGPNYEQLKRKGFTVLYPDVDDYVFLEVTPQNQKLLKKQQELSIFFLKNKREFRTVSEEELSRMKKVTSTDLLMENCGIEVINGYCENLTGTVVEIIGDKIRAKLQGYKRTYDVTIDRLDVIAKPVAATVA